MFKTRLISAVFIVIFTLLFVITGGPFLYVVSLALSLIGMMEFLRMVNIHKTLLAVIGYGAVTALYLMIYTGDLGYLVPVTVGFLMAAMLVYVVAFPKYKIDEVLYLFFGFFYAGVLLSYLYQTRMLDGGVFSVWLIFIAAWGSDTFAYCAGMLFGKHKAFPVLSPKKTWEGCIGGVLGAALSAAIYCVILNHFFEFSGSILQYACVCGCGAVIAQIGDLAASAMKRNNNIKDYGKLIPGHGGVLDRFDSIIFVAPIVYYLLKAFM